MRSKAPPPRAVTSVPRRVDRARVEELVGHLGRLVHEPAGIASQVEHDAAKVALGLRAKLGCGAEDLGVRVVLELLEAEVADLALEKARRDARHVDDLADEVEGQQVLVGLAPHGERDVRLGHAAHLVDELVERRARHVLAVDRDDAVTALDAGAVGG
jgi:hypothetical protein